MVTLDKQILKSYINTECDRYLFLELGEGSGDWMNPISAITPPSSPPFHLKVLEALGKKYERKIYNILLELPFTFIKRYSLLSLHSRILSSVKDGLLLIEYEFMQSKSFARRVFPKKDASTPLPIAQYRFRPDITIIRKINGNQVYELLPDGTIRHVPKGELSNRLG
ncbi:hypothetical protein GF325_16210, partial [Candidatus Bathyarchaeota archaeon]|nr:hypothetical protein [Candidatus Bathyarchaeota archaeon]